MTIEHPIVSKRCLKSNLREYPKTAMNDRQDANEGPVPDITLICWGTKEDVKLIPWIVGSAKTICNFKNLDNDVL